MNYTKRRTERAPPKMRMLSVKEAADILNICDTGVYNLIRRANDPLPAYKVGSIRIKEEELLSWLSKQRTAAA